MSTSELFSSTNRTRKEREAALQEAVYNEVMNLQNVQAKYQRWLHKPLSILKELKAEKKLEEENSQLNKGTSKIH